MTARGMQQSKRSYMVFLFTAMAVLSAIITVIGMSSFGVAPHCPYRDNATDYAELEVRRHQGEVMRRVIAFLSQPAVHHLNVSRTTNASCLPADLIVLVSSAAFRFERREALRSRFWQWSAIRVRMVFFVGVPLVEEGIVFDVETQTKLEEEVKWYKDVVQEDYNDLPGNALVKTLSMLRWASLYCQEVQHAIKMDDNMEVDLYKVTTAVKDTALVYRDFILGVKVANETLSSYVKDRGGRGGGWTGGEISGRHAPKEEPAEQVLPPYLRGSYWAMPIATLMLLYQAALRVKPMWMDDVFLTGACPKYVDVAIVNDETSSSLNIDI